MWNSNSPLICYITNAEILHTVGFHNLRWQLYSIPWCNCNKQNKAKKQLSAMSNCKSNAAEMILQARQPFSLKGVQFPYKNLVPTTCKEIAWSSVQFDVPFLHEEGVGGERWYCRITLKIKICLSKRFNLAFWPLSQNQTFKSQLHEFPFQGL